MALNPDQIEKVRLTLVTSGWNDVMRPSITNRGHNAVKALVLTRSERTAVYKGSDFDTDDDVLRAMIRDCEWMVSAWDNEVRVADHNRRLDELDGGQPPATANP